YGDPVTDVHRLVHTQHRVSHSRQIRGVNGSIKRAGVLVELLFGKTPKRRIRRADVKDPVLTRIGDPEDRLDGLGDAPEPFFTLLEFLSTLRQKIVGLLALCNVGVGTDHANRVAIAVP